MRALCLTLIVLGSACASRPGASVDADQLSRSIDALRAQLARQDERLEALSGQMSVLQSQGAVQSPRNTSRDVRDLEVVKLAPQQRRDVDEGDEEPVVLEITGEGDRLQVVKMPPAPKRNGGASNVAVVSTPLPRKNAAPAAKPDADPAFTGALESYREGRWEEAFERFALIVEKSGKTDKAAQAQYWMGESRFDEKRYNEAIEQYQRLIVTYPNSSKIPEAKFKIGVAYEKMNDNSHAHTAFELLVKEHPDSAVAELAQARLKVKR